MIKKAFFLFCLVFVSSGSLQSKESLSSTCSLEKSVYQNPAQPRYLSQEFCRENSNWKTCDLLIDMIRSITNLIRVSVLKTNLLVELTRAEELNAYWLSYERRQITADQQRLAEYQSANEGPIAECQESIASDKAILERHERIHQELQRLKRFTK
jgi:hypothetical protein